MTKEADKTLDRNKAEVTEVYSNSVNFTISIYDFTFKFGVTTDKPQDPKPLVHVKMSPQHAKAMSIILADNIAKYEKDIGKIELPKGFVDSLNKEKQTDEGH